MLAQGRYWRASLSKAGDSVVLALIRESLPEEMRDLKEFGIEIPLVKWNRVLKNVRTDRKLLGGVLFDFAKQKDHVSVAVGNDRLFGELQRLVLDASAAMVETGVLTLAVVDVGAD